MKVLQIMGSLHRGGAETIVMNYYRAFDKSICQFDFVVHAHFDNDYCEEVQKYGGKIIDLPKAGTVGLFKYIVALRKEIVKNGPYDVVHIHTNSQAFMCVIAAKLANIKHIVVHSHSTRFTSLTLPLNRVIFWLANVKRVACGEAAGKAMFGKSKYEILNNAIDASSFSHIILDETLQKKKYKDCVVLGHLGRLSQVKNQYYLIEIMKKLSKVRPVKLLIYGDGPLRTDLKRKIDDENLSDVIYLMGVTDKPNNIYKTFDIFLLPSLYEGFPVTLVETQMSGLATLASDKISRECDLGLGILQFLPLDVNIWVEEIIKIIDNPKVEVKEDVLYDKFKEYDTKYQWTKLLEIYKILSYGETL